MIHWQYTDVPCPPGFENEWHLIAKSILDGIQEHEPTVTTSLQNVTRGLDYLGLSAFVTITRADVDRVWGWPTPDLEFSCKARGWLTDPGFIAESDHGEGTRSYREPGGCHPAMQICFHPQLGGEFCEIDYDLAAPEADVASAIIHLGEVIDHAITHGTTDQDRISRMLDKRFA